MIVTNRSLGFIFGKEIKKTKKETNKKKNVLPNFWIIAVQLTLN